MTATLPPPVRTVEAPAAHPAPEPTVGVRPASSTPALRVDLTTVGCC